jgi:hypothetical protein
MPRFGYQTGNIKKLQVSESITFPKTGHVA